MNAPFVFPTDYDAARNLVAKYYGRGCKEINVMDLQRDRVSGDFTVADHPVPFCLTRADFLAAGF